MVKVVKLHQKLGKPIPSADPIVVGAKSSSPGASTSGGATGGATTPGKVSVSSSSPTTSKKESGASAAELKEDLLDLKEKEVEPVGQEYIEEIKGSEGDTAGKWIKLLWIHSKCISS